jgi:isopenicillin N synthase-like dioxygenase
MQVPVIDLSDPAVRRAEPNALAALDAACRDHGFFLIINHSHEAVVDKMWQAAQAFFNLDRDRLLEIIRTEDRPLGYYDRELTKQKRDLKQVFDFTRPLTDKKQRNQWPRDNEEFRQVMSDFYEAMSELSDQVLDMVVRALGVDQSRLLTGDANTSNVRLNYYPVDDPLTDEEQAQVNALGDMALHHHTDPGLITLLIQDATGGLQTLSASDGWIDVPPLDGSIIVNLGDALQAHSNDQYRAAVHRVLPMTDAPRMSTPYFYNPPADAVIEPHPDLVNEGAAFRPFAWREFIQSRIDDNFQDLGAQDTQVDKYRTRVQEI